MLFATITGSCLIWETMPAEEAARQQALQVGASGISFFSDDVGVQMTACLTSDARLRWSDGHVWERRVLSNPLWKSKRRWPAEGKRFPGISVDVSVVHAELVEPCTTASTDATCSTASTAEDAVRRHADWVERRMLIQFGGHEYGRVQEYWQSFWGDQLQSRV